MSAERKSLHSRYRRFRRLVCLCPWFRQSLCSTFGRLPGVAADAPKETTVGAGMSIEATLTNEGGDACLLDIGGASLGAVINSGDQTVWTSTTCPAEPTERPLLVDVGESARATMVVPIKSNPISSASIASCNVAQSAINF